MDLTRTAAVITAIVTIFVALAGYLITYWNNILLSRRTDRLNRINKQLNEFYGPLYSLVYSSSKSWVTFRTKYRSQKRSYFSDNPPPTEEELQAWRLWMTTAKIENSHYAQKNGKLKRSSHETKYKKLKYSPKFLLPTSCRSL